MLNTGSSQLGCQLDFDASLSNPIYGASNTVQPYSCTVRYIIKAFDGVTPTPAEADISEMLTELTGKADRDLDNLSADGENHFLERDFTIIYPNGGSEASPANITVNSRYVEANPFPGYYVKCEAEVFYNGKWGNTGKLDVTQTGIFIHGAAANQFDDNNIIIQTGTASVFDEMSAYSLSPFGSNIDAGKQSLPCRVKVWKIGKIPD
jgi:hypothetical protein